MLENGYLTIYYFVGIIYAIRLKLPPSDNLNNSFSLLLNGPYSENKLISWIN